MSNIHIIGIGAGGADGLHPREIDVIHKSDLLAGGQRQLSYFPDYQGEKFEIKGNLRELKDRLRRETKQVVVLASGDPLFYGIGAYLSGDIEANIVPHPSSVQLAFARMNESWQNAKIISVHGRSMTGLAQRIDGEEKIALLTDETNSPDAIARYLLDFHLAEYDAFVAENIGAQDERCRHLTLEEMADAHFSSLNVVILKKNRPSKQWPTGIPDDEFDQRKPDKGLITKRDVRILTIGRMNIKRDSVVWDIGTCTGSIAIEAAKIARNGAVFAVEKNEADLANAQANFKKFRTDVTLVHAKAPDGLDSFPDPDCVFMGGTAGNMDKLIQTCADRLKPGGTIVLNAVTIENMSKAHKLLKEAGFDVDIALAQVSLSKPILNMTRFDAQNPVYIICATRKEEQT
ncbi:bifunctional cobalt-precorrin-7 (C(5))-methyltransferase/cobalt-precorrin-6B (C(15))-methyltransferase [Domibacillus epiphyticus]|uniref:Cobalamin biosynthesis protein CbiE n=1 Tax=Domibacillus epiphyticus TaxID=1714355 RepID=A0A1V2A7E1_9BACI|nr:bifunctional cobalt-precorrin-7 (C(5))-methyltransferase/cobalt-precorrin-6B (C(15))-methyltransferase [Domibacillus epiphyticus]OMP66744.1 cobalamin biosynthesis protein CbiE [Domibacillus epiphyticus]